MDIANAAKIYKETAVKTADKGTIVIMLYEKAIQHLDNAIFLLKNKGFESYDKVNNCIVKTQEIVLELGASLDKNILPQLSENLFNLYLYFNKELREANFEKKPQRIIPVRAMLADLLTTWKKAAKSGSAPTTESRPNLNVRG